MSCVMQAGDGRGGGGGGSSDEGDGDGTDNEERDCGRPRSRGATTADVEHQGRRGRKSRRMRGGARDGRMIEGGEEGAGDECDLLCSLEAVGERRSLSGSSAQVATSGGERGRGNGEDGDALGGDGAAFAFESERRIGGRRKRKQSTTWFAGGEFFLGAQAAAETNNESN